MNWIKLACWFRSTGIGLFMYVFYGLVITTITGSLFSLFWFALRRRAGDGNEFLMTRCLRISVQFYLFPFLFFALLWRKGDTALTAFFLAESDPRKSLFFWSYAEDFWITVVGLTACAIGAVVVLVRYGKEKERLKEVLVCAEIETDGSVLERFGRLKERLGIHRNISLLRSCEGSMPCTVGVLRKKIIVPQNVSACGEKALDVVLAHELMHCRRHDMFFKGEFLAASFLHALNPLAHRMRKIHREYTETACDLETCEKMKDVFTGKEYFTVLLRLSILERQTEEAAAANITEKKNPLQKRVEVALGRKEGKRMKKRMVALVTALFVMGSSLTAYAAGNGMVAVHDRFAQTAAEVTVEENVWVNTLEERFVSEEEFASYGAVIVETGLDIARAGMQADWSLAAGETFMTPHYWLEKGTVVSVHFYTDPANQTIEVGLRRDNADIVSVSGTGTVLHQFTVSAAGYYNVFVRNLSGSRTVAKGTISY